MLLFDVELFARLMGSTPQAPLDVGRESLVTVQTVFRSRIARPWLIGVVAFTAWLTPGNSPSYASGTFRPIFNRGDPPMHRPSAQEFLLAVLGVLDDLPPDFARRLEEVLKKDNVDRSQAIRQLFEDFAGE
jgi:hypothetical protein